MRRTLGLVLSLLGAFLVVGAVLAQTWVIGAVKKTPIDSDSTTRLAGTAELSTADGLQTFDVLAWSVTYSDSEKSDGEVAAYVNSSCLVRNEGDIEGCVDEADPDSRLITASESTFATDRKTAVAVNDPAYTDASADPRSGLINKWPFDAEKKTYQYWDGVLARDVEAAYDRTTEIDGLEVYVYKVSIENETATISSSESSGDIEGTYTDEKEIWVDPVTGSIVNQVEQQQRVNADGSPFLSLDLAFTDAEVQEVVDDAKSSGSQLNLIGRTLPLIGYIVGIPALLVGLFLSWQASREPSPAPAGS